MNMKVLRIIRYILYLPFLYLVLVGIHCYLNGGGITVAEGFDAAALAIAMHIVMFWWVFLGCIIGIVGITSIINAINFQNEEMEGELF